MLLYNILLTLVLVLFSPIWLVLYLFDYYQLRERFALADPDVIDSRKSILLHGASLGEMGIIKKILPEVIKKYPGRPVIVSSSTLAGKKNILASMPELISHAVCLPLEFRFSVRALLRKTNPAVVVITETELWPNFILEAKRFGARVVLINGRLSDKSFPKYRAFKWFFGKTLFAFDAIGVQNREFFNRFLKLGADPSALSITGNIKTSLQVQPVNPDHRDALRLSLRLAPDRKIFIAASTRPGEEQIILSAFSLLRKEFPHLYLILAPRHLNRVPEVEALFKTAQVAYVKKTALTEAMVPEEALILDTHGELAGLFCLADAAFVGGTLVDFGGHNLLEPLPWLVPVCFGPYFSTQKESARLILSNECGAEVKDAEQLALFLRRVLTEQPYREKLQTNIHRILSKSDAYIQANVNLI